MVPKYLQLELVALRRAYSGGVPPGDYLPLLAVLQEELSARNVALVVGELTGKELVIVENAACHIAYGASILVAFEDLPEGLSDDELRDMGVNRAHVHTDLMIGSNEVEVDGLTPAGDAVPLLRGGDWQLA